MLARDGRENMTGFFEKDGKLRYMDKNREMERTEGRETTAVR